METIVIRARRVVFGAAMAALAAHPQALAQIVAQPPVAHLPEVNVTAERIESALHQTPLSVGVIGAAEIDRKGIFQLHDIVGVVAGVAVPSPYGNMPQAVGIRGVGVSQPAMSQAVGIYVDDVPLIRGYATALWDLPDIDRIEVLRGPQGTLHGQNATAGVVRIVSIDPSPVATAWIAAGAGNHGALEARGYASGALGSSTSGSIAFSHRHNDGFGRNASLNQQVNRLDATQFRAKLRWDASPRLNAVLAIDGLKDRSDTNTLNFPLNHPNAAPRVTFTTVTDGPFRREAHGISLKVSAQMGDGLWLRSITGYRAFSDDPTVADWGGLEVQRFTLSQRIEQKAVSQEFQLQRQDERLSWTAGVMAVRDRFDFRRFSTSFPPPATAPSTTEASTLQQTTDLAIYGQARYALSASTRLTAGLRSYRTRQTASNEFWRTDADLQRTAAVYLARGLTTSKSGWLPKLGIDHQWAPAVFLYASVAQGAKFGGFNRAAESQLAAQVATDPERVTALELGSKSRHFDGRLAASVAVFCNDYRDYLAALRGTTVNGVLVPDAVLINAGRARTYGIEVEVAAKATERADATLSLELLRSRFAEFANPSGAAGSDFVGNELPFAPRLTVGASIRHQQPLRTGARLSFETWLQYVRAQYTDVANSPQLKAPSQTYLNLGAAYATADKHWTFSVRVKNALDKTYVLQPVSVPPLGVDAAQYNAPRTLLLTARYDH
ncbi:TonB-dependent receptor [Piscinibacter sp. XHJ-5]|uniref:TonB-dependent receptor n=1 Tax=Piscinibacter sp. XHJ-5 TaxID=3037797 RepID=UPI002452FEB9|nr:TonB-dependent receptor [Piscinibacter sp. XHJ-5]